MCVCVCVCYLEVKTPVFHGLIHGLLRLSTYPKYPHILSPELLVELIELREVALRVCVNVCVCVCVRERELLTQDV